MHSRRMCRSASVHTVLSSPQHCIAGTICDLTLVNSIRILSLGPIVLARDRVQSSNSLNDRTCLIPPGYPSHPTHQSSLPAPITSPHAELSGVKSRITPVQLHDPRGLRSGERLDSGARIATKMVTRGNVQGFSSLHPRKRGK